MTRSWVELDARQMEKVPCRARVVLLHMYISMAKLRDVIASARRGIVKSHSKRA